MSNGAWYVRIVQRSERARSRLTDGLVHPSRVPRARDAATEGRAVALAALEDAILRRRWRIHGAALSGARSAGRREHARGRVHGLLLGTERNSQLDEARLSTDQTADIGGVSIGT